MPQIKVTLNIGLAGAEHTDVIDIDDKEWADCNSEEERDELKHETWKEWVWEYIDGGATLIEEATED